MYLPPRKTIHLHDKPIEFFIEQIKHGNTFSIAGYSDAEWHCIMETRVGSKTGLGQIIDSAHGALLLDVLKRRSQLRNFCIAIPRCINYLPGFDNYEIDDFLQSKFISLPNCYERDRITDDLARDAGLFPLICLSRNMKSVMIGNKYLKSLNFLALDQFHTIPSPNLHRNTVRSIDTVVHEVLSNPTQGLYLISAGVSAAVIIDRLHDRIPNSWFIDCGSIWDAFAGIGGHREWRNALFSNPTAHKEWIRKNLTGDKGVQELKVLNCHNLSHKIP